MSPRFVDRVLFAIAIASVGASFGDPFVELVGDAGAFGPGYHDVDHLGVAPALCTGLVVATILMVRRILGRLGRLHRDEALAFVRTAAVPSGAGHFLGIVALDFLGVRTIEAFEAVVSAPAPAHAAVPFGWLGAPVLIALAIHVTIVWLALRCARALASRRSKPWHALSPCWTGSTPPSRDRSCRPVPSTRARRRQLGRCRNGHGAFTACARPRTSFACSPKAFAIAWAREALDEVHP